MRHTHTKISKITFSPFCVFCLLLVMMLALMCDVPSETPLEKLVFCPFTLRPCLSLKVRCVSWWRSKMDPIFKSSLLGCVFLWRIEGNNVESYQWIVFIDSWCFIVIVWIPPPLPRFDLLVEDYIFFVFSWMWLISSDEVFLLASSVELEW